MNRNLLIAGIVGVVLFLLFIIMLMFTISGKNKETKQVAVDKPSTALQVQNQTQNQSLQMEPQIEPKPILESNQTKTEITTTQNQTSKTKKVKPKKIAKSKEKKPQCINEVNYIICENGICSTKDKVCGKVKEITINSIIYQSNR